MKSIADTKSYNQNNQAIRFTPRQLIKFHMEHPEIPIKDEDIENLILDFPDLSTWNDIEDNQGFNYTNKNSSLTTSML